MSTKKNWTGQEKVLRRFLTKKKGESRINQGDSLKEADIGTIFEFAQQK